jgi:arabinan endo-1,5-alpha-L-arabinosidase
MLARSKFFGPAGRRCHWRNVVVVLFILLARANAGAEDSTTRVPHPVELQALRLRDPYIWPDTNSQTYYLFNSTGQRGPNNRAAIVAFTSKNLRTWMGPYVIFETPEHFWAQRGIWAPEFHTFKGKDYLFTTFNSTDLLEPQRPGWPPLVKRGTQILVGDSPLGPFKPFNDGSTTPGTMMTLDGTFWVEDGVPYLIYAHEWVQIKDGAIEMIRLKGDLSGTIGSPTFLFHASEAPWVRAVPNYDGYVTDAPWIYRTKQGRLLMLWSSFGIHGYAVGVARSKSDKLAGPWMQQPHPLYGNDGGHAELFRRFDGQLMMILHQPNGAPNERARLFEVEEAGDNVQLEEPGTSTK